MTDREQEPVLSFNVSIGPFLSGMLLILVNGYMLFDIASSDQSYSFSFGCVCFLATVAITCGACLVFMSFSRKDKGS